MLTPMSTPAVRAVDGPTVRLYLRMDDDQWDEFRPRGENTMGEPVNPAGETLSFSVWCRFRVTSHADKRPETLVTLRNREHGDWVRRVRVDHESAEEWFLGPEDSPRLRKSDWMVLPGIE